jgi:hypothetical protein
MLAKLPAILSAKTNGPDFAAWAVLLFVPNESRVRLRTRPSSRSDWLFCSPLSVCFGT